MNRQLIKPLEPTTRSTRCTAVDAQVSYVMPTAVLCYAERLDPLRLRNSLARVLSDYDIFAGKLKLRDGHVHIDHGHAGVGFEVAESSESIRALGKAMRNSHSKVVCPHLSVFGALRGAGQLFAARLTQARDGSVLGVSWNHAVGDHYSMMMLVRAWTLAYRDQAYEKPLEVPDRIAYMREHLPELPRDDQFYRVLSWSEFSRCIYKQFWAPRPVRRIELEFTPGEIAEIHAAAVRDSFVSKHDALCAHVFLRLHRMFPDQVSPHFAITMNYRKQLGLASNLLGNASDMVCTTASPQADTASVAAALRASINTFGTSLVAERDLAQFKAQHPQFLQQMRYWAKVGDPFRTNLGLSNVARAGHDQLVFGSAGPVFTHVRAMDIPWVGLGSIFKSPDTDGVTIDMVLPAKLAERVLREGLLPSRGVGAQADQRDAVVDPANLAAVHLE